MLAICNLADNAVRENVIFTETAIIEWLIALASCAVT